VGHQHDPVLDPAHATAAGCVVRATRPAAVVLVGEGDLGGWIATRLRRDGFTGAVVAYVPIEGPVLDPAPLARLHNATAVVAYTRVGAAALLEAMTATARSGAVPDLAVIPHATDPATPAGSAEDSRQLMRAELMRAELIPDAGSVAGPWLLNANRNDWRKRPELTMRAFAPIAERHPDARLVMHCNPCRHDMDLRIERARLGLVDRVILTRDANQRPWPEERLSLLYASCEIGVSTTMAEAWGLVAFEHARHGAAQVMPRHAGLAEIWGDAPVWVPLGQRTRVDMTFGGAEPQVDPLTAILLNLIEHPPDMHSAGRACQRRARDPSLSWETVGTQWLTLIAKLLEEGSGSPRSAKEAITIRPPRATG
jgi:glycosyltransferase involved in cell wall biosynthesis